MKRGHIPIRTCRACGRKSPRPVLVRWTVARGEIVEDRQQVMSGRGIYCCPEGECRERLLKNKKKLNSMLRLKG